jgi:hypothetical protein
LRSKIGVPTPTTTGPIIKRTEWPEAIEPLEGGAFQTTNFAHG